MNQKPKTEREKMLADEPYLAIDEELSKMHMKARQLIHTFNFSLPHETQKRQKIISELFGTIGSNCEVKPPFYCDYGCHIFAKDNLYINYDCTILDCNTVHFGNNVLLGPKVQIYTAYHPLSAKERLSGQEMAAPIAIADNVWIGGGAIICQGVSIGANTTIGAGSVVTRDIPDNVFAAGNPCRVIKEINP